MTELDCVLRARRVVTAGEEVARSVGVAGGRVVAIEAYNSDLDARQMVELDEDEVLLPGLVDTHVHVNEPGRTEWEGFASATRAAAAGGITTILDMPLNSIPPTVDPAALQAKRHAADGQLHVDVGFWGGAIPGNVGELRGLHEAGVFGFKCFLLDSGVPEFPAVSPATLTRHLTQTAQLDALMIVHAEDEAWLEQAPKPDGASYAAFLASRPRQAENAAIEQVIEAARRTAARVHIVHLSSSDALPLIRAARDDGVRLTVEACPHYLVFSAEQIADGATYFKCCPPIREAENRDKLWAALAEGLIDCVVSDHSPCTPDLKRLASGDFGAAWGGIASLQVSLPAVWTEARRRGHSLVDVVRWMGERPAMLAGLARKGRIEIGADADFAVLAPDETFVVDPARLHHRNPLTPYAGRTMSGVVRSTWLRGQRITGDVPYGRMVARGRA